MKRNISGFTLMENLVAVMIIGVGMLGMVGMQLTGVRSNQGAYNRTQASIMASDIVDRMRMNSARAIAGDYDNFTTEDNDIEAPACATTAAGCNAATIVNLDMAEWSDLVSGADDSAILLPNAIGTITRGAGNLFTIQITWSETDWDAEANSKAVIQQNYTMNVSL
ncbi:MAG: type IV pilus modification protein PilV [Pseudomonadales bacterium]|nr:type IV pilus modification protein PilV [Pseudomonadales bacterium]